MQRWLAGEVQVTVVWAPAPAAFLGESATRYERRRHIPGSLNVPGRGDLEDWPADPTLPLATDGALSPAVRELVDRFARACAGTAAEENDRVLPRITAGRVVRRP